MNIICFLIAATASVIGSISGIGGGVIIKPVMDATTELSTATISFMSGCTVLSMAVSSYIRGLKNEVELNYSTTGWLAVGACIGGYIGKMSFASMKGGVLLLQSVLLLVINILLFLYLTNKSKIKTYNTKNRAVCVAIGLALGMVSAFIGIGGGPINIVVLSFFFSMAAKQTAKNSLFIILFSQASSLFTAIFTHNVPAFDVLSLILMCAGGVTGAIIGSAIAKKMSDDTTDKFFRILLVFLIVLNVYNITCAI